MVMGMFLWCAAFAAQAADAPLFNGKDLSGWTATAPGLWSVEDGAIVGRRAKDGRRIEYLWSEATVDDFYLAVTIKLAPDGGNSGINFRSRRVEDPFSPNRGQAVGLQADIGAGWWGKIYHEAGRGPLDRNERGEAAVRRGDWNRYEVLAVGNRVWTAINGTPAAALYDPAIEADGLLALQLHTQAQEVRFKDFVLVRRPKVELAGLDEAALTAALRPQPPARRRFQGKFEPEVGEVVVFAGGTNMVAAQFDGCLETLLAMGFADKRLVFRTMAWQGDTVGHQYRPLNMAPWVEQLRRVRAGILVLSFGAMEALEEGGSPQQFIRDYERLISLMAAQTERVVLVTPPPFEGPSSPHLPDLSARQADLGRYADAIRDLAARRGYVLVDLFRLTPASASERRTDDGVHWNARGQWAAAQATARALGAAPRGVTIDSATGRLTLEPAERLRRAIVEKNRLWHAYWRPTNWAFLYGDRTEQPSSRDHLDPKVRWFPQEVEALVPIIEAADRRIAEQAGAIR
jgi:hypothetical protein